MNRDSPGFWKRLFGTSGEREAERHLQAKGMRSLARGYRIPLGEIDLVMRDGKTVVFVEVKSRQSGRPADAVTLEKQRRITIAALHFIKRYKLQDHSSRFDVVGIVWPEGSKEPEIEHIPNAFEAVGKGQMFR